MRTFLFIMLIVITSSLKSQTYSINGAIQDHNNSPIPFANVVSNNVNIYGVADENGKFIIENVPSGTYTFNVSAIGFIASSKKITVSKNTTLNFSLEENIESLDDIIVTAKSESKRQNEKAISITSLGTQQVIDRPLGAEELLKKSTGVVIRQSGGLGSNVNINLNGLSRRAVRVFYDGIPLEVFGGGLQINTIPVDALERVDVYKGVMPIDIGTDALGGGINLVPLKKNAEYLRTSYSSGSFNTHRLTLNGRKNLSDKVSISTLSYFNYSDNDYVLRDIANLSIEGLNNVENIIDARAFHNRHISGYLEGAVRVKDLSWVDQLNIAGTYTARDDQVQNGIVLSPTAIGEATIDRTTLSARLDYKKKLLKDRLSLRYYGVIARTDLNVNDSTTNVYNWLGNILAREDGTILQNPSGAEIAGSPTKREGKNNSTAHRLVAKYDILDNLNFTVSDFYRRTKIEGEDPVGERININGQEIDLNTVPSTLKQNIFGAQLEATFLKQKLNAQLFYKNYDYQANSIDIFLITGDRIPTRTVSQNNNGYGFALKYDIADNFFVRTSFERAIRIPTTSEVFGDFVTISPNFDLKPEQSDNINLGLRYNKKLSGDVSFSIGLDGFIRNREDLIRLEVSNIGTGVFRNEAAVDGKGIEISAQVTPFKHLQLTGNYTTQSNEIASGNSTLVVEESSIGLEVPNIPLTFYNAGVNYTFENVLNSKNNLNLFWNYQVVKRYSINEVQDLDTANPDFIIPTQEVHNVGGTYRFRESGLSLSLTINNVLNAKVFDNWRIPRPGINYTFKVNYSIF